MELQAYKEHVKEEIAQEAADAGMTVEEYAANGYEPYATPEPEFIYKMEANPMTDGIHDRFFLQAYEKEDNGKAIPATCFLSERRNNAGSFWGSWKPGICHRNR